jgi:D-glycero-D-manno-heptose 1,7-bisphosphate phosphatase
VSRRYVFLDRDGTLVHDVGYGHRLEDYALLPGVRDGLRRLADAGFRLSVVTNQSGIGRGFYTEAQFHAFQARLREDLAEAGVTLDRTYFCPHLPDAGCSCRKPAPGLLERAARELGADLARSWVIGDRESDAELARRAGCRGAVLVGSGGDASARGDAATPPCVVHVCDLPAAAEWILATEARG